VSLLHNATGELKQEAVLGYMILEYFHRSLYLKRYSDMQVISVLIGKIEFQIALSHPNSDDRKKKRN